MVPEFGAALGCKGCFQIGQPHTEERRASFTAKMEQDAAHTKRLEENTTKRMELAGQAQDDVLPEGAATTVPKRARQDDAGTPQET